MELLRLRKRLVVAQRGHKLLKDKLDGLMQEFLEIAREYKHFRLSVDDELPYVLKLFVLAEITSSRKITENALENTKQELQLTVKPRRLMSVVIPKIEANFGTVRPIAVSFMPIRNGPAMPRRRSAASIRKAPIGYA
jgi:V/A-type H+-transporting ATPase subunit D